MALSQIPPWLNASPSFFTSALESGARTGLAVADMNQRAQEAAEARAQRQQEQERRTQQDAERQREFEQSRLFDLQKLKQTQAYETQKESRLQQFDLAKMAVEQAKADIAAKRQATTDDLARRRLDFQDAQLENRNAQIDLQMKHWDELERHNRETERQHDKEKEPTSVRNIFTADNPYYPAGHISGPLSQVGVPGQTNAPTVLTPPAAASPYDLKTPPTVGTKAEYDALPEGTVFIGSDGKPYRKPAKK